MSNGTILDKPFSKTAQHKKQDLSFHLPGNKSESMERKLGEKKGVAA